LNFFVRNLEWIPILGALIFLGGHFVAAQYYPGSHQWDFESVGYDIFKNFWCDLIWPELYTGEPNPSSGIGIFTTIFLTLSLAVFFIEFALHVPMSKISSYLIMFGGSVAMIFASLIFTDIHTEAIYLAAGFALIALIPMIAVLIRNRYNTLMIWGGVTIFLLVISIYQVATKWAYEILPFSQKIAFVIGLTWVIALCLKIRRLKKQG